MPEADPIWFTITGDENSVDLEAVDPPLTLHPKSVVRMARAGRTRDNGSTFSSERAFLDAD